MPELPETLEPSDPLKPLEDVSDFDAAMEILGRMTGGVRSGSRLIWKITRNEATFEAAVPAQPGTIFITIGGPNFVEVCVTDPHGRCALNIQTIRPEWIDRKEERERLSAACQELWDAVEETRLTKRGILFHLRGL